MGRRLLAAAAALAFSVLASPARAGDPTPFEKATDLFKKGDYAAASVEAEEVKASDPLYPKARYLLGECWLALGDAAGAEKAFRELLEKKPDSVPLLGALGRALAAQERRDVAVEAFRKALKLDPKDVVARRSLGECLAADNKPVEARKELERAQEIDPADPLTARALVEVLVKAGDVGNAAKAASTHQKAAPTSAMGDFLRGLVHDRNGNGKEAVACYEFAIEKDPKFLDAHKNLAILSVADNPGYRDQEKTDRALKHFAKYFELGGKDQELKRAFDEMKAFLETQKEKKKEK
jgi:tetratricopeptide (TPR) repeat protein